MKYLGYYSIGGGQTYNRYGYEYTNLREARRDMREMASGSCPQGSSGMWWVTEDGNDDNVVAEGRV